MSDSPDISVDAPWTQHFDAREWARFQEVLGCIEEAMVPLSQQYGCRLLRNQRGNEWPSRRIRCRKGLRVYELRLELNPNFLEDREERYELSVLRFFEPLPIWVSLERSEDVAALSPEEARDRTKALAAVRAGMVAMGLGP